ncbi:ATP-binding protein [Burkholderia ubonensis]|uniref:ATP-binding protein n=1 Tax=Burkholderia ubonensis TaxID=101571 RepID=UPI000AAA1D77|nr:ATP-binding protein [Burkholderia ubonensis]
MQRRQVAIARECAENLTGLLDMIIDYARLGTSVETAMATDFDPRQWVQSVVELIRPRAAAQRTAVQVRIDDSVPAALHADAGKLRQVLINLLSNAVKFTEQGCIGVTLALRASEEGGPLLDLVVEDNGIGIPADKLGKIFDEFTQADDSIARRFGGAGLGLAVSKRLVHLLGGTIVATSEAAVGSRFCVTIPVAPAIAVATAVSASPASTRLKVLVVDDDPINQIVACGLLAQLGHDAAPAASGSAAIAELEREDFDAVFMDLHMPLMDGFEAARRIRSLAARDRATVPIVALTADVMLVQDSRFTELCLSDVLPKPLRRDALRRVLAAIDATAVPPMRKDPERTWSTDVSIDLMHLNEQVAALGVRGVARLVHLFRQIGSHLLDELETALARGDPYRVQQVAHRFGSSASALGFVRLYRLTDRVEQVAKRVDSPAMLEQVTPLVIELAIEFQRGFDALRELVHETRRARSGRQVPQSTLASSR